MIKDTINHPIAYFIYGCVWFGIGISYWQLQLLHELGFIGIFITGVHLLIGFVFIGGNYHYVIYSSYRKQYRLDQIELQKQKMEFEKLW